MKAKTKIKIILAIVLIIVVINWSTISDLIKTNKNKITGESVSEIIPNETSVKPEIYFCPQDDCIGEMLSWLDAAEKSIHCAIFEIGLEELNEKLDQKSKEIDVKLITDSDYYEKVKELDFARQDNRAGLMHNKFCILDGKAVWTGSFNPTERGNYKNDNNVVFYQSKNLAKNYEEEFQEMWSGEFGKGKMTENAKMMINGKMAESYFCPEDWCANKAIYALQEANESIYFMTFSFTHDLIGKQILERAAKGVKIKGVFEKSQRNDYTEYDKFIDAGLDVRWDGNSASMHHKVFIIDNRTVITGSFNPTSNADERNDENLLIIHDEEVAEKFMEEFERVWEAAK